MSCFHPLHALPIPGMKTVKNGKPVFRFLKPLDPLYNREDVILIPCGQCVGCRISRAREWADRLMLEKEYHDSSYFVTLTYNDEHVPKSYYADPDTGLAHPSLTLSKRDLQLFMKRLRAAFPNDKIRFYACGEYGPQTWRPHYHMILFGIHLNDLQLKRQDVNGHVNAWFSPSLQAAWSLRPFGNHSPILDSLGDVECSDVTWSACNYVARYILKKQLGPSGREFYDTYNILPPFTVMSRKPGIGRQYYDDHVGSIYEYDSIALSTPTGGRQLRPSHYYDSLYDLEDSDKLEEIKQIRKTMAENARKFTLSRTTLSPELYDELREREFESKLPKEFDL